MPKTRFYNSEFQNKLNKMELRIIKTDEALPIHLQECLHYTATAKLAPQWNTVQQLLVQSRDFLLASGPLRAIKFDIVVDGNEIILNVIPKCIKLPPFRVEAYSKLYDLTDNAISIQENVHVLPSLKKGKAVFLSRTIPTKQIFKDYTEIKKHWKNMYGYRLPDIPEKDMWYLDVVFKVPFSTSYTYPFFCARPFGMTEILRVDPQLTLHSFMNDFCKKVRNICQEEIQILDSKAAFPSVQLYRIDQIMENSLPRPGTTYTKTQRIPLKSAIVNQVNDGKLTNNSVDSTSEAKEKHCNLFSENKVFRNLEQKINGQENNFSCTTKETSNKDQSSEKLKNSTSETKRANINNVVGDNATKLLTIEKQSDGVSKITPISNNQLETQPKYVPRFFPRKLNENKNNPSLNGNFQDNLNQATESQEKFVPRFFSKQPKQNSQLITDIYPIVKSAKHFSKLSLGKVRNISQPHAEIKQQNTDLKLISDKISNPAACRKVKASKMNSEKGIGWKVKCLQDEVAKDTRKNINSRKRVNDEINFLKENDSKINKKVKQLTLKAK